MPAIPSLVLFRKVVNWGLTPQAINFAQSSFMGHRVCFNVPVDFMNEYFKWTRYSRELRPTGRFVNDITGVIANAPTFQELIERCLGAEYTDIDGVAQGLNYSSDALDTVEDVKRDICVDNATWDYTPLVANPATAATSTPTSTHYGANDFVMAFVLNKCFGSSSFDAYDIVYNLEDGFGMLTSAQLAAAITASLQEEEDKASQQVLPVKEVDNQTAADDKGQVDAMFRSLLSIDPQRFFKQGKQIKGLFETNYICSSAVFTGYITTANSTATAKDTLVVTSVTSGRLSLGNVLTVASAGVAADVFIIAMAPGTTGGVGTYTLSADNGVALGTASAPVSMSTDQDVQGFEGNITAATPSGYKLTVTNTLAGAVEIASGSFISGFGLARGTTVTQITPPVTVPPTPVTEYTLVFPPGFTPNSSQLSASHYFTTPTPDPDAAGNWCLAVGDKIEIPVRFYFRAPVTVLSVTDNAKNPSSATPDQVETVFIKGEGITFDATNAAHVAAADKGNVMAIRLQILCTQPVLGNTTRSSSEDIVNNPLALQVVHRASLIFYKGANYPNQESIALVVVGGTGSYTYAFTSGGTVDQATLIASDSPPGIDINPSTGMLSFQPTSVNAAPGRWKVGVTITDGGSTSVTTDIYITVDGVAGSSGPPSLTMPAPTSINNFNPIAPLGNNTYSISGYTQTMINAGNSDTIQFNPTASISGGSWVITASVTTTTGGNSSVTTPTIPTSISGSLNIVSYNSSLGEVYLSSGDAAYPPGSSVVFTAVCTRTSDGAVGTTILNVAMPLTEIVPRLVMDQSDTSITLDTSQISSGIYTYNVGDNASIQTTYPGSQYITVVGVPAAAGYSIVVVPLQGMGQSTWNSTLSQIDITTNANFGTGTQTIGKGYKFTYEDGTANKMPLGITSGNDELMVNVIDNYQ